MNRKGRRDAVEQRIRAAEQAIRDAGFELGYVEWCEDATTPGILGYYGGVTVPDLKLVKIGTHGATRRMLAHRLEHELRHVTDPAWDCGNRPLFWSREQELAWEARKAAMQTVPAL